MVTALAFALHFGASSVSGFGVSGAAFAFALGMEGSAFALAFGAPLALQATLVRFSRAKASIDLGWDGKFNVGSM